MAVTLPQVEMEGPFEVHTLPNGDMVFYRDKDHAYFRDIKHQKNGEWVGRGRLLGVSTVVATYSWKADHLMRWAARLERAGIAQLASLGLTCDDAEDMWNELSWLRDERTIWDALKQAQLTWEDQRNLAGNRGTRVHKFALQTLAEGGRMPDWKEMTEEDKAYARGVVSWWLDTNPQPVAAEHVVADLDMGIAGRLDLIARIGQETVLVDAKTGRYLGATAAVQQAGYRYLAEASGLGVVDRAILLKVDEQGGYLPVEADADFEDFEAAVHVYRRANELSTSMRKAIG